MFFCVCCSIVVVRDACCRKHFLFSGEKTITRCLGFSELGQGGSFQRGIFSFPLQVNKRLDIKWSVPSSLSGN